MPSYIDSAGIVPHRKLYLCVIVIVADASDLFMNLWTHKCGVLVIIGE